MDGVIAPQTENFGLHSIVEFLDGDTVFWIDFCFGIYRQLYRIRIFYFRTTQLNVHTPLERLTLTVVIYPLFFDLSVKATGPNKNARTCSQSWNHFSRETDWNLKPDRWSRGRGRRINPQQQHLSLATVSQERFTVRGSSPPCPSAASPPSCRL